MAIAEVGSAVGTLLAVVLALYLQVYREWRHRPRLGLSLGSNAAGIGLGEGVAGEAHSIGLRVTAATKRRTAHRVEVIVTADWHNLEYGTSLRVLDHETLHWIGGEETATALSLGPGISREASLAVIGRPLDLYERVGMPRPTPQALQRENGATSAFGVFDIRPRQFELFLHDHLEYRLRIDVTARDVDTVSYETAFRIGMRWKGDQPPPTTHAARNERGVEINLMWAPLREVVLDDRSLPPSKVWYGTPFR